MRPSHLFAVILALAAGDAAAHEYQLGQLTIEHPYATATPPAAKTGAAYMTIDNGGAEADRLIAVRADFPKVMLHTTEVDAGGVARMSETGGVEIPPGGSVTFEPQGTHVMFMGLKQPFVDGQKIDATLVFEKAGEIGVTFNVEARGAGDHEGMDMDMDMDAEPTPSQ